MAGTVSDTTIVNGKAFVIAGMRESGTETKATVGVLFAQQQPDMKALKNMGFVPKPGLSVDTVSVTNEMPPNPKLYLFERTPAARHVTVANVSSTGTLSGMTQLQGEPRMIIPEVKGAAAEKYILPRNGLGISDFPKPQNGGNGRQRQPIFAR